MHPKEGGGGELRESEGVRKRREVMLSMSSDVMGKVYVKFMSFQVLSATLAYECVISSVRCGVKLFVTQPSK